MINVELLTMITMLIANEQINVLKITMLIAYKQINVQSMIHNVQSMIHITLTLANAITITTLVIYSRLALRGASTSTSLGRHPEAYISSGLISPPLRCVKEGPLRELKRPSCFPLSVVHCLHALIG